MLSSYIKKLNFLPGIIRLLCDFFPLNSSRKIFKSVPWCTEHLQVVEIFCLVQGYLARHFNFARLETSVVSGLCSGWFLYCWIIYNFHHPLTRCKLKQDEEKTAHHCGSEGYTAFGWNEYNGCLFLTAKDWDAAYQGSHPGTDPARMCALTDAISHLHHQCLSCHHLKPPMSSSSWSQGPCENHCKSLQYCIIYCIRKWGF